MVTGFSTRILSFRTNTLSHVGAQTVVGLPPTRLANNLDTFTHATITVRFGTDNPTPQPELTLVMIKPRGLYVADNIEAFLKEKGFTIHISKEHVLSEQEVKTLYDGLNADYIPDTLRAFAKKSVRLLMVSGPNAASAIAALKGDKNIPQKGTLRALFPPEGGGKSNTVHCSDNVDAAIRELRIFFSEAEIEAAQLQLTPPAPESGTVG